MLKINILTLAKRDAFLRQLDYIKFPPTQYYFAENSEENIIWDLVVVYEGIEKPSNIRYKKGGLLFISGEPPMSSVYTQQFINQFDNLITAHPNLKHPHNHIFQQSLDWHYGYSSTNDSYNIFFKDMYEMPMPAKTKDISIITSSKTMMPGHNWRLKIIQQLKSDFMNKIDFFGKGINTVDDKATAINPYRFHICIENSYINDYWTEKFADPLLGYSIPIYAGCKNMEKYFSPNSYISFNIKDYKALKNIINEILESPQETYDKYLPILIESRHKLMDSYNLFPVLINFYIKYVQPIQLDEVKNAIIIPNNNCNGYKYLLYKLRLKRLLLKQYIKLS